MKKLETKSMVLLKHHLKALRMPTMHDECEKIAARCATENVDHLGFLLQLCEHPSVLTLNSIKELVATFETLAIVRRRKNATDRKSPSVGSARKQRANGWTPAVLPKPNARS